MKAKIIHGLKNKINDINDLILDLFRAQKNMCIILGKAAYAQQPVQNPGLFLTVNSPQFKIPDGQIAVRTGLGFINKYVGNCVFT